MRVISKKTLVVFYQNHKDAETALEEWYKRQLTLIGRTSLRLGKPLIPPIMSETIG